MIYDQKFLVLSDFESTFFSFCQILNQFFYNVSDFELKISRRDRFSIGIFYLSPPYTFHIAFLYITMCSYNPQYLRHLDNSIFHRWNNTFCTLFRKDFHFWLRNGVPLSFLILLDICKNPLLLKVKLQQLIQF